MKINEIIAAIEYEAPLHYQESYDNCGLQIGNKDIEATSVLLTIDITEAVIDEAIKLGANLIITHHPLIFSGIKKLTGKNLVERCVVKAIQNNIAIYAAHTNVDATSEGVSNIMCNKLKLKNCKILQPVTNQLLKLVTFVPQTHTEKVREAMLNAGAGHIGNYDNCSFYNQGFGTFRGNDQSSPFVGKENVLHTEPETRIETIVPRHLIGTVTKALIAAHPYEEPAYDIIAIENPNPKFGFGMIGEVIMPHEETIYLKKIKDTFKLTTFKHTAIRSKTIKKVAVCGGSGSGLLHEAIKQGADIFISSDFKYHQYFEAEGRIIIADIGHFESEQFTKEYFYNILNKKFSTFAVHFSSINTNPINYV